MKILAATISVILALGLNAQNKGVNNPLIGAWKVVSTKNLTTGSHENEPENYYYIFSEGHQMEILADKNRKKVPANFWKMTSDEIKSQMPAGAGFFSYKIKNDTIVRTIQTAMSAFVEGKVVKTHFNLNKDTLILKDDRYVDGNLREWKLVKID